MGQQTPLLGMVTRVRLHSHPAGKLRRHRLAKLRGMASKSKNEHPTTFWVATALILGVLQFFMPALGAASWALFGVTVPSLSTRHPACLDLTVALAGIVFTSIFGPLCHVLFV